MLPATKKNLFIASCYSGVLILGMIIGAKFSKDNQSTQIGLSAPFASGIRTEKVDKILELINRQYVDPVTVDTLQNVAIQNILKKLDPHSAYLPPADAKQLSEELEGNFNGIGVEYYLLNDTLLVTAVNSGGPADLAGLKRGDKVMRINNKLIAGNHTLAKDIIASMRGERGSKIDLAIMRQGIVAIKSISVTRDKINVSSIDAAYMLNPQSGYVKISKFGGKTAQDFADALGILQKNGMKNLVLDLRGNGGGYLNAATALADQLLPDKKLIVYTQGEHEPRTDFFATQEGAFQHGNLVVLIDENTASASEIVAGAVQDLDRGTIIGRRSFGKGLVQEQFDFGDGSVVNLTVARYYTPLGRSIQRSYKNGKEAYYDEIQNRFKSGESTSDRKHLMDSLSKTDKRFKTASGRVMFNGGGIMPDIYVPVDTTGYTNFYYELSSGGILNDFMYSSLLKSVDPTSLNLLMKNYRLTDEQYNALLIYSKEKGIRFAATEAELSRPVINTELKALLARYYFGDEGYYKMINANDKTIVKSLEVFNTPGKAFHAFKNN